MVIPANAGTHLPCLFVFGALVLGTAVRELSRVAIGCCYGPGLGAQERVAGTTVSIMSPELAFGLTLALRMAITAAFVVSASVITERSGPVIGALVATLPISAGPSYVFLAVDHDAAFIAEGALASLPINAATIWLALTYVVLAQRHNVLISCGAA